jgi:hypothetical protein
MTVLTIPRVTQKSSLARQCTLYQGEAYVDFYKIIEVASYVTYSSHAPKLDTGSDSKSGQVVIDIFDIHLTYDNKITWRNNGPICRGWKAYYPVWPPFPRPDPGNRKGNASHAEGAVLRCRDKRVASTNGRLAIVPFVASVGDVCCVVKGIDVPIVLRRTESGT